MKGKKHRINGEDVRGGNRKEVCQKMTGVVNSHLREKRQLQTLESERTRRASERDELMSQKTESQSSRFFQTPPTTPPTSKKEPREEVEDAWHYEPASP